MLTPSVELAGFYVQPCMSSTGTVQTGYFDVGFGATPVSILNNGKDIYNNVSGNSLYYPIGVPAGVPISICAEIIGGTAGALYFNIIGIPLDGDNAKDRCAVVQILNAGGGDGNGFGVISATAPGTLYGTTLAMPTRLVDIFGLAYISTGNGSVDISLSVGPSSTSLQTVIGDFCCGIYSAGPTFGQNFRMKIPPSQELYLFAKSSTLTSFGGILRLFY